MFVLLSAPIPQHTALCAQGVSRDRGFQEEECSDCNKVNQLGSSVIQASFFDDVAQKSNG